MYSLGPVKHEYDWETQKWKLVPNPRSEWKIYYDRNLSIIPMEL